MQIKMEIKKIPYKIITTHNTFQAVYATLINSFTHYANLIEDKLATFKAIKIRN